MRESGGERENKGEQGAENLSRLRGVAAACRSITRILARGSRLLGYQGRKGKDHG